MKQIDNDNPFPTVVKGGSTERLDAVRALALAFANHLSDTKPLVYRVANAGKNG